MVVVWIFNGGSGNYFWLILVVAIIFGGNFGSDKLGFVAEFWWWLSFGREEKECNFLYYLMV